MNYKNDNILKLKQHGNPYGHTQQNKRDKNYNQLINITFLPHTGVGGRGKESMNVLVLSVNVARSH